jgi:hypothetical protein
MQTLIRSILCTGALAMGANGLIAAQGENIQFEQWYNAKYGRNSPAEEARLKVERDSTAFRVEIPAHTEPAGQDRTEQYFRTKFGRSTPAEEARLNRQRESGAFRQELGAAPAAPWIEEWYRAKFGRDPR